VRERGHADSWMDGGLVASGDWGVASRSGGACRVERAQHTARGGGLGILGARRKERGGGGGGRRQAVRTRVIRVPVPGQRDAAAGRHGTRRRPGG